MSKSNAHETAYLEHLFQNKAMAEVGDAGGLQPSSAAGTITVRLHTVDPGEADPGTANEATYTGYAAQTVARSDAAWDVTGNVASNINAITFPECTAGSETITHYSLHDSAGLYLGAGELTTALAVSSGVTPNIPAGEITWTEE